MKYFIICINVLQINCLLYPGDRCTFGNDKHGVCTSIYDCEQAILKLRSGVRPIHCGFDRSTPIVCCPSEKNLSAEKCREYIDQAARDITRIVGGLDVLTPKEYPHMAAIGYGNASEPLFKCGGSLISENYVLTAAHCIETNYGKAKLVQLGDVFLNSKIAAIYTINKTITHPDYTAGSTYNDIALLKLNKTVEFTQYIQPACLSYPKFTKRDLEKLTATGWGLTEYGGSASDRLMKVEIQTFDLDECNKNYKISRRLSTGIQQEIQLCAGGRNVVKDTCQGDSGGPLQKLLPETLLHMHLIVGITSFGKTCGIANVPGVYTRVSYFLPWIENVVWT